jgi:hypothetical protein
MVWSMHLVVSIAGVLLQQPSSGIPGDATSKPAGAAAEVRVTDCSCHPKPRTKTAPCSKIPSCTDTGKAFCESALGYKYFQLGRWDEALQHCGAAMAANASDLTAMACLQQGQEAIRLQRVREATERLGLINGLIGEREYSTAQDQLKALATDEQRAMAKYGPLDQVALGIRDSTRRLADAQQKEWPNYLPKVLGIHDWLPGVISAVGRVLTFCLLGGLLGLLVWGVAVFLRNVFRRVRWRKVADPEYVIRWSVSSITDKTKQFAAGALIDALNVDYNPLFQRLYTSSFLAAPPALLEANAHGDPSTLVFRNLFVDLLAPDRLRLVRGYLSPLTEAIDIPAFARHRFTQVRAYEDIKLKLGGVVEASLGAITNAIRSWSMSGWPSVTGSVFFETINNVTFASVRLVANFGISSVRHRELVSRGTVRAPGSEDQLEENEMMFDKSPETMRKFFSQDRTLSVFASTQVDETADAVALASQRAAFRLLYRLARRPADPGLAIAASSYRQGVRLLNTVL